MKHTKHDNFTLSLFHLLYRRINSTGLMFKGPKWQLFQYPQAQTYIPKLIHTHTRMYSFTHNTCTLLQVKHIKSHFFLNFNESGQSMILFTSNDYGNAKIDTTWIFFCFFFLIFSLLSNVNLFTACAPDSGLIECMT